MNAFETPLADLVAEWEQDGVPCEQPGFYDHPHYVRTERDQPDYIAAYARYVRERTYAPAYLARSRQVIREAAALLGRAVAEDGRPNLCVAVSKVLSKMLEREGVWNYVAAGALAVAFHVGPQRLTRHFFPFDVRPVDAAHAWVVAPPFRVVDLTIRQQRYPGPVQAYLPPHVLARHTQPAPIQLQELCAPALLRGLHLGGFSDGDILERVWPGGHRFSACFPPERLPAADAWLTYVPTRIVTPEGDLPHLNGLSINGKTPEHLYRQLREQVR